MSPCGDVLLLPDNLTWNGLTPGSMEIGGIAGFYVRSFYDRTSVLSKSFRETTVETVTKQVGTCGGWLVVLSQDSRIETLIEYERVFEGMLLRIRERKIAIHPMTQMLEETPARDGIAKELGLAGEVQWILRIRLFTVLPGPREPPHALIPARHYLMTRR